MEDNRDKQLEEALKAEVEAEAREKAEAEAKEMVEETAAEPKKRRKRRKIWEVTPENDMKYRGPLSYRTLSILGWLCIAFGQVDTRGC